MRAYAQGLSLIELLIVVAVVGILASIAYPSYTDTVKSAARTEVAGMLLASAQQLERHRARTGEYADSDSVTTPLPPGTRHYSLHASREAERFSLVARRRVEGLMAGDRCGDFELDHRGVRGNPHGDAGQGCWGN
ncbi:prepilin-type N-terminal cleavage/methylation domain-containing protein [Pseudomonas sp. MAFF212428]|uniref:Prepilin-type N-terminal cleavage/methylation domain-containing protein n=1 Tax=Pseudomonas brassicae TaxID=2708063 RepID=A0A6B3NTW5_9PSED|nr:type IV pilin protein [Pseudomonas brassicae]NER61462.1 prepilin-type N-terminal cleavage/methylation domain-containing protein [Pseudomonas brassicae]NER62987.1 prepilin-type N-terminal cleavage/methylation domain-containing protein [Pseudomonas brassicae]